MIINKLENMLKRYEGLQGQTADPKVIADNAQYRRIAKELSGLSKVVVKYKEYKRLLEEMDSLESILRDKDKDMELAQVAADELHSLESKREGVYKELEDLLLAEGEEKAGAVIIEIRAGTGGLEAALFAGDLFRMYSKYAGLKGWEIELIDRSPSEMGGYKEIIFAAEGEGVYERLRFESGVHRVQRVPKTEAQGRIHTSTATVAVLREADPVEVKIEPVDLRVDTYRASGAGGQHVNKTSSAVRITHLPTGMVVTCQDERSQIKNRDRALRVLRARLLDKMRQEQTKKITDERRAQVGTGERSEKIRTYNFPDRRVTDHRIGKTVYNLEGVLDGGLDEFINALIDEERKIRLSS